MYKFIYTILILTLSAISFGSEPNTSICNYFIAGSEHPDPDIQGLLRKLDKNKSVKLCKADNGNNAVYVASQIKYIDALAYYHLRRVFKVSVSSDIQWSSSPPKNKSNLAYSTTYMIGNPIKEVAHDDIEFVQTSGVSAGVFSLWIKQWNSISESAGEFENLVEKLPSYPRQLEAIKELREALFEKKANQKPQLRSMKFNKEGRGLPPHYSFILAKPRMSWLVKFDLNESEIKLLEVILMKT